MPDGGSLAVGDITLLRLTPKREVLALSRREFGEDGFTDGSKKACGLRLFRSRAFCAFLEHTKVLVVLPCLEDGLPLTAGENAIANEIEGGEGSSLVVAFVDSPRGRPQVPKTYSPKARSQKAKSERKCVVTVRVA